jgi:glycosyltransferase involved in cell wall biosynthesis
MIIWWDASPDVVDSGARGWTRLGLARILGAMSSRIALLTPFAFPSVRGNAVTVDRVAAGLTARGVDLRVWDLSLASDATVASEVEAYAPDLVHGFHAFRTGGLALRLARRLEVPLVITLTGTDANHDLFDPARAPLVRHVLEGASRVVVFHPSIADRVTAALPDLGERFAVVPQAVVFGRGETYPLDAHWALPPSRVLFLFPAGLRAVKRPRLPLAAFDHLVARRPEVRLLYVGPTLDPEEGRALDAALSRRPWAKHLGAVPHEAMASLLAASDVVLNCSLSEGGMANSVLEAFATGRAVLASDTPGNRSLVEDGVTGFLFRDEGGLLVAAERLAADPALRARLGTAGRELVERRFPPEREVDGYLEAYRQVIPMAAA